MQSSLIHEKLSQQKPKGVVGFRICHNFTTNVAQTLSDTPKRKHLHKLFMCKKLQLIVRKKGAVGSSLVQCGKTLPGFFSTSLVAQIFFSHSQKLLMDLFCLLSELKRRGGSLQKINSRSNSFAWRFQGEKYYSYPMHHTTSNALPLLSSMKLFLKHYY